MILTPELISRLSPLELKARQVVEGFIAGLHRSPFYGFSVEFAEHRPYNPGDEIRHIDWKVYGKSERYYVKQYEEETNLRCHLVMDVSSSMLYRYHAAHTKLHYAIHFGAAMLYMMHRQRDASGLITFDNKIEQFIPAKASYSHLRHIYKQLEQFMPAEGDAKADPFNRRATASAEVIHEIAERLHRRSMVIIMTDLFENPEQHDALLSSLKHLRHKNHEVILFHVLERRSERELDFPDQRYVFEDLETGAEMDLIPAQVRDDYKAQIAEYTSRFKRVCRENRIEFEEIDTEGSFDIGLLAYLNKRRRL
jgi:uncharacterized protein (DUF58 family)